jgi:hypothetical protein
LTPSGLSGDGRPRLRRRPLPVEIDAGGNLVTESFVNPHVQLCKVFTLPMMEEVALKAYRGEAMARSTDAIELASKIRRNTRSPGSSRTRGAPSRSQRFTERCTFGRSPMSTPRRSSKE